MPARVSYPDDLTPTQVAEQSPLYRKFVEDFSEQDGLSMLESASHRPDRPRLDDYFADCIVVAIAYNCFTTYRERHAFFASTTDVTDWIKANVDFKPYAAIAGEMVDTYKKAFEVYL